MSPANHSSALHYQPILFSALHHQPTIFLLYITSQPYEACRWKQLHSFYVLRTEPLSLSFGSPWRWSSATDINFLPVCFKQNSFMTKFCLKPTDSNVPHKPVSSCFSVLPLQCSVKKTSLLTAESWRCCFPPTLAGPRVSCCSPHSTLQDWRPVKAPTCLCSRMNSLASPLAQGGKITSSSWTPFCLQPVQIPVMNMLIINQTHHH